MNDIQSLIEMKLGENFEKSNEVMQRCINKLKSTLEQEPENLDNLEDVVDKVIVNYELLSEENKLLMQEREFYYD